MNPGASREEESSEGEEMSEDDRPILDYRTARNGSPEPSRMELVSAVGLLLLIVITVVGFTIVYIAVGFWTH